MMVHFMDERINILFNEKNPAYVSPIKSAENLKFNLK